MYARVTTSQVDPSNAEEVEAIMQDIVLPILRRQKGFKSYISFVDRASGKAITATVWETEEDRQASDQSSEYYKEAIAKVTPFFKAQPIVENYEVEIYS
jgi:quinol monooxygenase YgiN